MKLYNLCTKVQYSNCKYNEIVSLGYNCEVSQRLQDIFNKKFEHYLFTWSYECDRELFLESLNNLNNFTESEYSILPNGMIKHERYNIRFHSRFSKDQLINNDGSFTNNVEPAINELKERLTYLSNKTENIFKTNKKILFIIKLKRTNIQDDFNYIEKLNKILSLKFTEKSPEYTLLVVIEKNNYSKNELKLINSKNNQYIKYEAISHFADDPYTDIHGDIFGWYRVIKKYLL